MMNYVYQSNKTMYNFLSLFLLLNTFVIKAFAAESEFTLSNNESTRLLQAGSFSGKNSSSGSGSSGAAAGVGALVGLASSGFFKTTGGKIVGGVIALVVIVAICYKCIKKKQGEAPSETKFFEGNDQGEDTSEDNSIDNFELPFYSGLYSGIYEQQGTQMPVQPFEIYFQEQFIESDGGDDDSVGPTTIFHTITGKGADMVGPYTLSGKSVGNKVSIKKKYYGQGNQAADIGHEVQLQLDKLGDTHIFEGKYYVNTDELQEQGLYQIWPVGYNNNAAMQQPIQQPMHSTPPPPADAFAALNEDKIEKHDATSQMSDEENQIPVATLVSEEFETISLDHEKKQKN